jgi:hypothetical protein
LIGIERLIPVISSLRAAHASSEKNPYALPIGVRHIEARIVDRLPCGHDGELTHAIQHSQLRSLEMLIAVEVYASRERGNKPLAPRLVNTTNGGASSGGINE